MEEIEYLEEYEDLILPMSFAVDDGKCNERLDGRKSIDSVEMLYKDLIEETSLPQNQADISPFSLNPQMISPEKILSSSTDIGLSQSFPNYSLNTTPPTYVNTTNTDTLTPYQAQTSNVQFLNRLTNKGFSTYSSLQKPEKLKSVATVKPTLQRISNPPKQYVQKESPVVRAGQSVAPAQHNSTKSSGTKATFGLKKSSKISKNKGSVKLSKFPTSGVDPLAGLNDDELLDFDEKNDLVNGFDFESDLENSIIAGLSEMDSDSVDLSDDFIDDNFDLESDLSSGESDLKKILKRKKSHSGTQDSAERQTNATNSVKKKLALNSKSLPDVHHIQKSHTTDPKEKLPVATSNVTKDSSIVPFSTKVSELLDNGSNILPQLHGKLNEHEHAHVSNVLNLTPTVPLYNNPAEKTEIAIKQLLSPLSNGKCAPQTKDERTYATVNEPPSSKSTEHQTADMAKNNLIGQNVLKSPQRCPEASNQKDVSSEKSQRPKLGSLYLRSIKPPTKTATANNVPTNTSSKIDPYKTPSSSQSTKAIEESPAASQKDISSITAPKNTITNYLIAHSLTAIASTNSIDVAKLREKRKSVPRISTLKDHESLPNVGERELPKLKRHKSLGAIIVKERSSGKNKKTIENSKQQQILSKSQTIISKLNEGDTRKEVNLVRPLESKQMDSRPKVKPLPTTSVSTSKTPEARKAESSEKQIKQPAPKVLDARKDDSSDKPKEQYQVKQSVPKTVEVRKEVSSEKTKVQTQVKQSVPKTVEVRKEVSSEKTKVQTQVKQYVPKTVEVRKEVSSEKTKVQAQVKQSAPKMPDVAKEVSSEKTKVQAQVKQSKTVEVRKTLDVRKEVAPQKPKLHSEPKQSTPKAAEARRDVPTEKPKVQSHVKESVPKQINDASEKSKPQSEVKQSAPRPPDSRKNDSFEKSKLQPQVKRSPIKITAGCDDSAPDKPKMQLKLKQKHGNNDEQPPEKVKVFTKAKTPKERNTNEMLKTQSQAKIPYVAEQTVITPEKTTAQNQLGTKEKDPSEISAKIKRRRTVVNGSRKRSSERGVDKRAAAADVTECKEKVDKQVKAMEKQKIAEDKRLHPVCNESTSQQGNKNNNILYTSPTQQPPQLEKIQSLHQPAEKKLSPLVQNSLPPIKRRRRRFKNLHSNSEEKLSSPSKPDPSLSHAARTNVENPLLQNELQSPVRPPTAENVMQQHAEKDCSPNEQSSVTAPPAQKVIFQTTEPPPRKVNSSTTPSSQLRVKKYPKIRPGKHSRRMQQPMSPSKTVSLEQKNLKLRRFKIRLDRRTVDHFMKAIKDRSTLQSASDSGFGTVASSASSIQAPKIDVTQRPVGRPRKKLQKTEPQEPAKSEVKEVNSESQSSANLSTVASGKISEDEPKIENEDTLQVKALGRQKRRRRMKPGRPAKIMRSNTPPSADKSDIVNKDCSNDPEHCLADETQTVQATQTKAPSMAAPTEASILPAPMEVSGLETSTKVITPIVSSKTISTNVPTIAISPTIPTDAASPTAPTGASNLETATSRASVDRKILETFPTSSSPSSSKKRGRPFSRKTLRREALARRLELIRASTSQRLPCTDVIKSREESTPDPVSAEGSTELTEEFIIQPSVPTDNIASPTAPHLQDLITESEFAASVKAPSPPEEPSSSAISQSQDTVHLATENLVQPKVESGDSFNYQGSGLGVDMFASAPTSYSFAKPADTCLPPSELLLDTCHIASNSFDSEQNGNTKTVAIFDLPSYIVMRTRIITRGDLQKNKAAVPLQVKETVRKLAESGHVAPPVVKEEAPNFKDICLEINTLLGKNANYLKFASGSERQARMNQVLSDSSLSAQEAQSALKFLQSYLSVRSKERAVVNNTKGQQFIPIYDSQKKVIGYRKRRVEPKNPSQPTQSIRRSSKPVNRTSIPSSSRTASTTTASESLSITQTSVEFTTKKEPIILDGGDEELIVPDSTLANASPIKSEVES